MFIRVVKKQRSKTAKIFYQYSLVQNSRIDGKVKQNTILYLGSDPLLEDKTNRKLVLEALKSHIFGQPDIFPSEIPKPLKTLASQYFDKYLIRYDLHIDKVPPAIPPLPEQAEYQPVDIKGLELRDVKNYGAERLCKQVLEKLDMVNCLRSVGFTSDQIQTGLISIAARSIYSCSEYKTSQILEMNSELPQMYGIEKRITHNQLYTIADELYKVKDTIDSHIYNRVCSMFNLDDRLVIFDISNTYFETSKRQSKLANYGKSKEKRNDCPLVVFTGVINAEGFIRHSRIYEGNKSDMSTMEEMLRDLEKHSQSKLSSTIVIDAGIAQELTWTKNTTKVREDKGKGIYFLRTNYNNPGEQQLWDIYNTIREVESTFRCLKTDLSIRPVHHQLDARIESHIYLTILAYQLVNTIRYLLKQYELNYDWKNILRILSTHTIQTIVMPSQTKTIHLRIPSTPIKEVKQIYLATNCHNTQKTIKKDVVYH